MHIRTVVSVIFVKQFRELPQWKNTVIVFVPDHLGSYPEHIGNLEIARYQIPLLMVGGAVREPGRVDVYGSQQDIAATFAGATVIAAW